MSTASANASGQRTRQGGNARLATVDGLRAMAALWVVLFHIRAFSGAHLPFGLDLVVRSGSIGVSLFLVLSGFCLYSPFAGERLHAFRTRSFLARRCRRLLPTYYVSLAVFIALDVIAGGHLGIPSETAAGSIEQGVTHIALVHQFLPFTFYGVNGSYWSLGLEWELYLALPLLVFAARRIGVWRVIVAVIALNACYRVGLALAVADGALASHSALATDVLPNLLVGRWGEFALGMAAAELYSKRRVDSLVKPAALSLPVLGAAGLLLRTTPIGHLVFGLLFSTLLCLVLARDNVVARVFAWPPLVVVGVMSYSLYLVHQPIIQLEAALVGAGSGSSPSRVFLELLLLFPVTLFVAFVLFVAVERRSLTTRALEDVPGVFLLRAFGRHPRAEAPPAGPPGLWVVLDLPEGGRATALAGEVRGGLGGLGRLRLWVEGRRRAFLVPDSAGPGSSRVPMPTRQLASESVDAVISGEPA